MSTSRSALDLFFFFFPLLVIPLSFPSRYFSNLRLNLSFFFFFWFSSFLRVSERLSYATKFDVAFVWILFRNARYMVPQRGTNRKDKLFNDNTKLVAPTNHYFLIVTFSFIEKNDNQNRKYCTLARVFVKYVAFSTKMRERKREKNKRIPWFSTNFLGNVTIPSTRSFSAIPFILRMKHAPRNIKYFIYIIYIYPYIRFDRSCIYNRMYISYPIHLFCTGKNTVKSCH